MSDTTRSRSILATASRLFATRGYSRTTTAEIAREAGVAEGTLYHHFGSKDGIFLTLFDETMEGYLAGIEGILARGATGRETLSAFARFHFDYVSLRKEQYLILLRDFPIHLTVEHFASGSPQREKLDRITRLFSRILARGKADRTFHLPFPVRETAEMLRGSFYGVTRLKMLDLIQAPFPRLARMTETYWLQALAPRGPAKVPRRKRSFPLKIPPAASDRQG
jgi:TetR/AcrR family transcriptional regulator, fatty acid metabolism regulator protein